VPEEEKVEFEGEVVEAPPDAMFRARIVYRHRQWSPRPT
jgi:translation initiation factor IF-1